MNEIVTGYYRSYEGEKYLVMMIIPTETGEEWVIYYQLFGSKEVLAMRLHEFRGDVEIEGSKHPRFEYIGESLPPS
jgi:hypothetical protein